MTRSLAAALALALFAPAEARAQDIADETPTAEQMIEVARQRHLPPGVRKPCPQGGPGEIVVCAPDPEQYRVSSPIDDAIAEGRPVYDGVARAPDVFGLPPCEVVGCISMGFKPPPIYIIDLSAIPEPLSAEEAALVFRAPDPPPP